MADNSGFPECEVGDLITSLGDSTVLSLEAEADITKGWPVYLTSDLKVSPSTGNDNAVGIALKTVSTGDQCPVCTRGIVKVEAAGSIARGAAVRSASNGKVAQLTDQDVDEGGTATYTIYYARKLGIALCSASADGDQILILVGK
ncbi:DUF2190 family protein [Candidatus Bathyarchaeota archaeon]|nr:DUF2190 family protein [Candidatus Bathyarchaeota archaeon]